MSQPETCRSFSLFWFQYFIARKHNLADYLCAFELAWGDYFGPWPLSWVILWKRPWKRHPRLSSTIMVIKFHKLIAQWFAFVLLRSLTKSSNEWWRQNETKAPFGRALTRWGVMGMTDQPTPNWVVECLIFYLHSVLSRVCLEDKYEFCSPLCDTRNEI